MDRDTLLDLLARAVMDGTITEDEARALLAAYDAGELPEIALPLPTAEAVRGLSAVEIGVGATLFALTRRGIVDWFDGEAARLAPGAGELARWHADMARIVRAHLAAQHMAGAGKPEIASAERPRLDAVAVTQTAFLARFADTMAIAQLRRAPLSDAAVAARSTLYAGAGYAEGFRAQESRIDATGWVFDYRARDDGHTCSACLAAELGGPYLAGAGPMPGETCRGYGHCRCTRVARYDTKAHAALSGVTRAEDRTGASGDSAGTPPAPPPGQPPPSGPLGIPISDRLEVPAGASFDFARTALAAIDAVHGDGDLPTVPVRLGQVRIGAFVVGRDGSLRIDAMSLGSRRTLSFAHEIGHLLDHQTLGIAGQYASESGRMRPLMGAIAQSTAIQELEALQGKRAVAVRDVQRARLNYTVSQREVAYHLEPKERFARAYAQYIATRSGDPDMLANLAAKRRDTIAQLVYHEQWDDNDFAAISAQFDALFRRRGWMQ